MKFISHRGNLIGPNPNQENRPAYIMEALRLEYEVEIDVWFCKDYPFQPMGWYLGHDAPEYLVPWQFLEMDGLWLHCKNVAAFENLTRRDARGGTYAPKVKQFFWHQKDELAMVSNGATWSVNRETAKKTNGVWMVVDENQPKTIYDNFTEHNLNGLAGICTDYPKNWDTLGRPTVQSRRRGTPKL